MDSELHEELEEMMGVDSEEETQGESEEVEAEFSEESEESQEEEVIADSTEEETLSESLDDPEEEVIEASETSEQAPLQAEEKAEPTMSAVEDPMLAELRQQNQQLLQLLQSNKEAAEAQDAKPAIEVPPSFDELFSSINFDDLMSDKEVFSGFMQKAMAMMAERSVERVATQMPQYVISQIEQQKFLSEASDTFYSAHEELVPFKRVVGMLTNEVIAEHQDWELAQVLDDVASRAYKMLNLKKKAEKIVEKSSQRGARQKPALHRRATSGGKRPMADLSKLQRGINDLM